MARVSSRKSDQLQIRVTSQQKDALKRQAAAAGLDVSSYVLARALPPRHARFAALLQALLLPDYRFALAELNDFLTACPPMEFEEAVAHVPPGALSPLLRNYVAAMVELAATQKRRQPPIWTHDIAPLDTPYFGSSLVSLRFYLLRSAPVPFKRRNLFVDSSLGDRV
jgi:hypothetical protein